MAESITKRLKKFEHNMERAESYDEWKLAAMGHDEASGMAAWKDMDQTRSFDHASIRRRLGRLRDLRAKKDDHGLLFALNEGIHGNMGGMAAPALYSRPKFGTKQLITDYIDEIVDALDYLAHLEVEGLGFEEKLDFFKRASHCYGRSALMLSGGAMLGFFHMGVVKALLEQQILPRVVSGASAGALVTGVLGTHTDEELERFFDPAELVIEAESEAGWFNRILLGRHPQIDVHDLENTIERLIPELTFQQAYELTGREINISVAPAEEHQTSRLLNAITSPNVYVRSAVLASCAIPGVFSPVTLEAQNIYGEKQPYLPSRKWVDGSVSEDLPVMRLARIYGVNHYIASQTNPLVLMMVRDSAAEQGFGSFMVDMAQQSFKEWARFAHGMGRRYSRNWSRFNLLRNMAVSVVTQEYTADINIIPRYRSFNPRRLLSPLSEKELMWLITEGERSTWPKLELIRNCSKISRKLDEILDHFSAKDVSARSASL
jgi:TAG lipase/steryl ester hydrolase/phospholipase A2/LPA acyltransferase